MSKQPSHIPSTHPSTSIQPTIQPSIQPSSSNIPTQNGYTLYYWGNSKSIGQNSIQYTTPQLFSDNVIYTSVSSLYSIIIMSSGIAYSCGNVVLKSRYQGHLGREGVVQGINSLQPIDTVMDINGLSISSPRFSKVYAGVEQSSNSGIIHTILLDVNGKAYAAGSNSRGQLCQGDTLNRDIPQLIPMDKRVVDVAIGGEHTLLLLEDGSVYGCGSNNVGQLGLELTQQVKSPTRIPNLDSVLSISAGHSHSLFTTQNGLYNTGSNQYKQLCRSQSGNVRVPTLLGVAPIEKVNKFKAGKYSSYVLFNDKSVGSCGRNNYGQVSRSC